MKISKKQIVLISIIPIVGTLLLFLVLKSALNPENTPPEFKRNLASEINFDFSCEVSNVEDISPFHDLKVASLTKVVSDVNAFDQREKGIAYFLILEKNEGEMIIADHNDVEVGDSIVYSRSKQRVFVYRSDEIVDDFRPTSGNFGLRVYKLARRKSNF